MLKAGGLSDIKLQELILTLRNRHIHKRDSSNLCNTLETHIELISLKKVMGEAEVNIMVKILMKMQLGVS